MDLAFSFVGFIIFAALVFDFLNGFHDAANSIATVVSTRVMSPRAAVAWAAFFNFVALFVFGLGVAKTLGKGMIDLNVVTSEVVLGGLMGAIFWNIITWYYGIPVSSSHALIGGYAGAAVARGGWGAIIASGWTKTLLFIVLSPVIGALLGFSLMVLVTWIFRKWKPFALDTLFRRLQLFSAAFFSLNHGGNDAQKTMGIIAGLLVASGHQKEFSHLVQRFLNCLGSPVVRDSHCSCPQNTSIAWSATVSPSAPVSTFFSTSIRPTAFSVQMNMFCPWS